MPIFHHFTHFSVFFNKKDGELLDPGHAKNRRQVRVKVKVEIFSFENELLYPEGCAIIYIIRHRDKGKKQDLLKAIHFIEMIIERDYS